MKVAPHESLSVQDMSTQEPRGPGRVSEGFIYGDVNIQSA